MRLSVADKGLTTEAAASPPCASPFVKGGVLAQLGQHTPLLLNGSGSWGRYFTEVLK